MKQKLRFLFLLIALSGAWLAAPAQIYVAIRPPTPVVVRTVQPSPSHIWIREEWVADGPKYRYVGGRWESPEKPGYRYHKGYWKRNGKKGHAWNPGGWKKN